LIASFQITLIEGMNGSGQKCSDNRKPNRSRPHPECPHILPRTPAFPQRGCDVYEQFHKHSVFEITDPCGVESIHDIVTADIESVAAAARLLATLLNTSFWQGEISHKERTGSKLSVMAKFISLTRLPAQD
jgi:hypothetical protein